MRKFDELHLQLEDTQWPRTVVDHDRHIARAMVVDDLGRYYFVGGHRNDAFGDVDWVETAGGGVEKGEKVEEAILREISEELGAEAEVVCKIGTVSDYYHLIRRHNINHYFLCRVHAFGERHLTAYEKSSFELKVLCMTYGEAVAAYEACLASPFGTLVGNRELPILHRAQEIWQAMAEEKHHGV